jgi:hypothetical protein
LPIAGHWEIDQRSVINSGACVGVTWCRTGCELTEQGAEVLNEGMVLRRQWLAILSVSRGGEALLEGIEENS